MGDLQVINERTRKYGLDFLKGIAACFVVFMHVRFPGVFGYGIALFGRVAVPIFFMTSGYFGYGASREKTLRSIKKTSVYLLVAYILGLIALPITTGFDMQRLALLFKNEIFTIKHLIHFVLFTHTIVCGVAWFLISLLLCYVLKYYLGVKLRYIAYAGLLIRVLGAFQYPFLHITVPVNTPWVTGIPFFIIGELIRENEQWINEKISNSHCVLIALFGAGILSISFVYPSLFWYIAILMLSPALFVLFSRSDMQFNQVCLLGSVYAFFIYIVHPLVMHVYDAIRPTPSVPESWLRPLIVLIVTILLAVMYYGIKKLISKNKAVK